MKIFDGIPPNAGNQSIQQGAKAVINRVQQVINGRAEWSLFELGLDAEDSRWLSDWACNLQPEVVHFWLRNEQPAENAEAQEIFAAYLGTLLVLLAVENARVGLPQTNGWPLPVSLQYAAEARPTLFAGDDPLPEQLRAINLAAKKLRLRRGLSTDPKQWLRETIALQINPADEPEEDLPRWIPETIASVTERIRLQTPAPVVHTHAPPTVVNGRHSPAISAYDQVSTNDIFGQIEDRAGVATIEEAARAMLDRAREKGLLSGPWSLTELAPTDYDYIWLRVWIKRLDKNTVDYCSSLFRRFEWSGNEYPLQAAFGLLLMMWISESARRNAEEGTLWPWVPKDAIQPAARRLLFAQEQPSSSLKELLELAARRFNLRHVFGRAGAQQWIDTIFLQFGFTRRGFERRLPGWLSGQTATVAVQHLLDLKTGSASFQTLWEALRNYRQSNVTREHALKKVRKSAWILPEWRDRVFALATAQAAGSDAAVNAAHPPEPEACDSFLTEPLLRWDPPAAPYFVCRLVYLDSLGLTEDVYDVTVGGRVQTQLLRRADGSYSPAGGDEIRLPFDVAHAAVKVVGSEEQVMAAEDVELWPASEDVVIFQLSTGRRLADAYKDTMRTQAQYAALTAPDLRLEPPTAHYCVGAAARLFYLPGGWNADTRVLLDDSVLWEPLLQQRQEPATPAWAGLVSLLVDSPFDSHRLLRWGDKIHLKVRHSADVTVSFVRYSGRPLDFQPLNERCARVGPLTLSPEIGAGNVRLQLGFKHQNKTHRVALEINDNVVGVAKLKNGVWKPLSERLVLKSETARNAQFKIAPPRRWDGEERTVGDWALMEGDLWLKNLSRNHTPIGEVAGLGAPLTLRLGPYNADRDAAPVAQMVIDRGVVDELQKVEGELRLRLLRPIEPSDQHRIVYWDVNGRIHDLQPRAQEEAPHDIWRCSLPADAHDYVAVALMFEGWRLGAWWANDWHTRIEAMAETDPRATATMLRWFRLPLLAERSLDTVRGIAQKHPMDFLTAWLREGDCSRFNQPALTEGWLAAVRAIFLDWEPDAESSLQLIAELGGEQESGDAFQRGAWRLLEVDPRLLYKILSAWLAKELDQQFAKEKIKLLRLRIAEARNETDYAHQRQQLLEEGANEWNVNTAFIDIGVIQRAINSARGERLSRRDEMNIALAISSGSLRRLLAVSLLKTIA